MGTSAAEPIRRLLVENLPRDLILGVHDALNIGAQRAYMAARGLDKGHLPSAVGQLRHFHMSETFHHALSANGAQPSQIRGNSIVAGRCGLFALARFNVRGDVWLNGRRSHIRRQMSLANAALEPLVQPELFSEFAPALEATAFFVACFAGSLMYQPDCPLTIQIAVPDRWMREWLHREPLDEFVKCYDGNEIEQPDLAVPKLKLNVGRQHDESGTAA